MEIKVNLNITGQEILENGDEILAWLEEANEVLSAITELGFGSPVSVGYMDPELSFEIGEILDDEEETGNPLDDRIDVDTFLEELENIVSEANTEGNDNDE